MTMGKITEKDLVKFIEVYRQLNYAMSCDCFSLDGAGDFCAIVYGEYDDSQEEWSINSVLEALEKT